MSKTSPKLYSAFVSSNFTNMRSERYEIIEKLLDLRIFPFCQEHEQFEDFREIEKCIDESDFFVLLLGKDYGSVDKRSGLSWTELEYDYAVEKGKPIVAMRTKELAELCQMPCSQLDEFQQKQVEFCDKVSFPRDITEEFTITNILGKYFHAERFNRSIGWTRQENGVMTEKQLERWQEDNRAFDISGMWHHVHLSNADPSYIRIGTVRIEQEFLPDKYLDLRLEGENYNVRYFDSQSGLMKKNIGTHSYFEGKYSMELSGKTGGKISGRYTTTRNFNGTFGSEEVGEGIKFGRHYFKFHVSDSVIDYIEGEFRDEAPGKKYGEIYLFASIKDRDEFLLDERKDYIEQR